MSTLFDRHTLTSASGLTAAVSELGYSQVPAGTYDGGLLTLVDGLASKSLLSTWPSLAGRFDVVLTTAFGDAYVVDRRDSKVYMLLAQEAFFDYVDDEVAWVLDEYLKNPDIIRDILQRQKCERLVNRYRPLQYHEAFVLEPWQVLGGVEADENYSIGDCAVYLDLLGQTHTCLNVARD